MLLGKINNIVAISVEIGNVSGVVEQSPGQFHTILPNIYGKQTGVVSNIWRYKDQKINVNELSVVGAGLTAVSDDDLNKKEWYLDNLSFTEDIWDFNQIESDKIPSLK
jgi:hypothetical protein